MVAPAYPPMLQQPPYGYAPQVTLRPPTKPTSVAKIIAVILILAGSGVLVIGSCAGLVLGKHSTTSAPISTQCLDHPYDPGCAKHQSSLFAKAEVKCVPVGDTFSCSVASVGTGPAKACWDIVVTCTTGQRRTHGCSGTVPSGSTEVYSIVSSEPAAAGDTCTSMRIDNMTL